MNKIRQFFDPPLHLQWWKDWFVILLGCAFVATGFVFFINPYNIVPGGIYGLSIVVHNLIPVLQIGTISYFFEIPLLIISFIFLGKGMGIRTVIAALIVPSLMNVLSLMAYPTTEALQALDPSQLLGGKLNLSDHLILTTVMGGCMMGVGCGLIARNRATGGGTDIIAMLVQKYLHIPYSRGILIVDAIVVLTGFLVIGCGLGDPDEGPAEYYLSLYSLIAIYVASRVIGFTINGAKSEKIIFVIGAKRMDLLRDYIVHDLDRSATCIKSTGLYSGKEKDMLFIIVKEKQVTLVKRKIKEFEPNSFVVITDAYDTYGEGFRNLPSLHEITPE